MKSVYSTINNIMGIFVIASLAAMVLGLGIAIIIARAITRPIEEMKQQTQRIARGDYAGQVRVYSDDELGQLAKAINNLSIRVEESQESTEAERRRLDSVLSHMSDGVIATRIDKLLMALANGQIKTILSNYNNTNVDEIQVVD
ncbi:histidine kinase, partial [Lactiplantibacillus plantarum]